MNEAQALLTVIVLTRDEAMHLPRLIESCRGLSCRILVVDSGSTDGTPEVARHLGAEVYNHPFESHAAQFNWALDQLPIDTPWVMRMDADEYLLPALVEELGRTLSAAPAVVGGWMVRRRVYFWGRWIRHGGYYPTWLLRVWRTGAGRIEERLMDEHAVLSKGEIRRFEHDIVDENLKGLGPWIDKHNRYADHEVLDLVAGNTGLEDAGAPAGQAGRRRRLKFSLYGRAPLFLRAFLYWFYRYFVRLGLLDGVPGLVFHFLQGFWYRFLVDAKLYERRLRETGAWGETAGKPARDSERDLS